MVRKWVLGFLVVGACLPSAFSQDAIPEAVAVEKPATAVPPADEPPSNSKLRPLTVNVELTSQASIGGTLVDASQVQMKTAFGEASIPMSEIAGIRFASGQDNTTTVVMLNGDSITGAIDLKVLNVETEWGSAKINGSSIQSLLFVPDLKWVNSNGLNGRRWFLVEAGKAPVQQANQPAAATSGIGNIPNSNANSNLPAPNIPGVRPGGPSVGNPAIFPRQN